jgi:hypothetical protein
MNLPDPPGDPFFCPECGHRHDPEFLCALDCLTCMLQREEDEESVPDPCEI